MQDTKADIGNLEARLAGDEDSYKKYLVTGAPSLQQVLLTSVAIFAKVHTRIFL